jgi:hypothetical protein
MRLLMLSSMVAVAGCGGAGDAESLARLLDEDRQAHLETDAGLIAGHLADSLIAISDGRITVETRDQAREFFQAYFDGARYHAWEDVIPPIVRVHPGGRSAWVLRRVRVDREEPALGGRVARRQFTSAWAASYEWRNGRWQMTTVTTSSEPDSPTDRILAGAARAIANEDAPPLDAIRATADAQGPGARFEVTVTSRRSGEVRIEFSNGLAAGIAPDTAWWTEAGRPAAALSPPLESFLRGHELHMMLLAPATRVRNPAFTGEIALGGTPALRLSGVNSAGTPVELYFTAQDTLPLGMRIDDTLRGAGPVTVVVGDWVLQKSHRVFQRAEFRQGREIFRYRFTAIDINPATAD